jgi:tubulin polyglutamylase TTLL4
VPKTWILPEDLRRFSKEREDTEKHRLWILKPANNACGRGIKILTKTSSLPKKGQYVICKYVMRPHLINGFKYDLRLYVFITSYEPLTIYLYHEGLVRFAT